MSTAVLPGQLALDLDTPPGEQEPLPAYVPTDRLRPHIEAWLGHGRLLRDLADATGIAPETLRAIREGKRALTRFGVADRIITALNPMIWHTPPEHGGLGDIYRSPLCRNGAGRAPPHP